MNKKYNFFVNFLTFFIFLINFVNFPVMNKEKVPSLEINLKKLFNNIYNTFLKICLPFIKSFLYNIISR